MEPSLARQHDPPLTGEGHGLSLGLAQRPQVQPRTRQGTEQRPVGIDIVDEVEPELLVVPDRHDPSAALEGRGGRPRRTPDRKLAEPRGAPAEALHEDGLDAGAVPPAGCRHAMDLDGVVPALGHEEEGLVREERHRLHVSRPMGEANIEAIGRIRPGGAGRRLPDAVELDPCPSLEVVARVRQVEASAAPSWPAGLTAEPDLGGTGAGRHVFPVHVCRPVHAHPVQEATLVRHPQDLGRPPGVVVGPEGGPIARNRRRCDPGALPRLGRKRVGVATLHAGRRTDQGMAGPASGGERPERRECRNHDPGPRGAAGAGRGDGHQLPGGASPTRPPARTSATISRRAAWKSESAGAP